MSPITRSRVYVEVILVRIGFGIMLIAALTPTAAGEKLNAKPPLATTLPSQVKTAPQVTPKLVIASAPSLDHLSLDQRLLAQRYVQTLVEALAAAELSGLPDPRPLVSVRLAFDDARFVEDARKFHERSRDAASARYAVEEAEGKRLLSELSYIKPPQPLENAETEYPLDKQEQKIEAAPATGQRFGKLNLDLDFNSIKAITLNEISKAQLKAEYLEEHRPVSLALQIAPSAATNVGEFRASPLDYVSRLDVDVTLPAAAEEAAAQRVEASIKAHAELARLFATGAGVIKVTRLKSATPLEKPSWLRAFLSPSNAALGLVLAALIVGAVIFLSALVVARHLGRVTGRVVQDSSPEQAARAISSSPNEVGRGPVVIHEVEDTTLRRADTEEDLASLIAKVDDEVVLEVAKGATSIELAHMLSVLPIHRANVALAEAGTDVVRAAAELLRTEAELPDAERQALVKRIRDVKERRATGEEAYRRLVLKLVAAADVEDEAQIDSMVADDDFALRRDMLRTRFFMRDLPHLDTSALVDALKVLDPKQIADAMIVLGSPLAESVMPVVERMTSAERSAVEERARAVEASKDLLRTMLVSRASVLLPLVRALTDLMQRDEGIVSQILSRRLASKKVESQSARAS